MKVLKEMWNMIESFLLDVGLWRLVFFISILELDIKKFLCLNVFLIPLQHM